MGRPRKFYVVQAQTSEPTSRGAVNTPFPTLLANALSILQQSGNAGDNMTATPSPGSDYRTLQPQSSSDSFDSQATMALSGHLGAVHYPGSRHSSLCFESLEAPDWSRQSFNNFVQPLLSEAATSPDAVCSEEYSKCYDYLEAYHRRLTSILTSANQNQVSVFLIKGLFTGTQIIQTAISCPICCHYANTDLMKLEMMANIFHILVDTWHLITQCLTYSHMEALASPTYLTLRSTDPSYRSELLERWRRHLQCEVILGTRVSCVNAESAPIVSLLSLSELLERKEFIAFNNGYRDIPYALPYLDFPAVGPAHPETQRFRLVFAIAGAVRDAGIKFGFTPTEFGNRM